MPGSTQSTSPSTNSRSVESSGQARSPVVVHGPSSMRAGITCQIGSRMLASAPGLEDGAQEGRREVGLTDAGGDLGLHVGDGLLGDPQALAHGRQLVGGLGRLGRADHPSARPSGAPEANRIDCSRRSALVHSSMAITAPAGTNPPSCVANSCTPSSKSR